MKLRSQISLVAVLGLGLAGLFTSRPLPGVSQATAAPVPKTEQKYAYAFLYGEAVADANAPPAAGFTMKRITWMLGTADGTKLSPLDKNKVRQDVAPVGRTVILKKDANKVALLGPGGKDLELSLKKGPLADAKLPDLQLRTVTFSFSPDGKTLAFVNEAGNDCRIALDKMELTVGKLTGLNPSDGIRFSHDGKRIAFARQDETRYRVCVADPDAGNEVSLVDVVVTDAHALGGFDFLPDERIGLVSKKGMRVFDAKTGKEGDTVTWKTPLKMSSFGGWCPDGSAFVFEDGGPYLLDLYHFDVKTQKVTLVKKKYLESFQRVVWVKVPAK